uniref:Cystatin domain-containing protein n=1 Tax=Quercus lobata TaxID=97700 RepID=A0A7N2LTR3_QUELO
MVAACRRRLQGDDFGGGLCDGILPLVGSAVLDEAGTDGGQWFGRRCWLLCWLGNEKLMWGCRVYTDCRGWFADLVRQGLRLLWFANLVGQKYQPPLDSFSHTRVTMKTQNCLYLLTLLTLSLYTTAMEGKLGVLDKRDWQPIQNIKDHFIQSIGAVSVFQYDKKSGSLLRFVEVFNGDTQVDNGTYYQLDLTAEDSVVTKEIPSNCVG